MTEPTISDFRQLVVAIRYQFQYYLRTSRFIVLLLLNLSILTAVFAALLYFVGKSTLASGGSAAGYLVLSLSFLGITIFLDAAMLGGDAISADFGARTGYYTLVLPVRRSILFFGRFTAATLATCVLVTAYVGYSTVQALYIYGTAPGLEILATLGIAFVFTAAVMGLAFFFSSLVKTPAISIVLTVLVLYIILPIAVEIVTALSTQNPWWSLTSVEPAIPLPFGHTGFALFGGAEMWVPTLAQAFGIMLGYLAAFVAIGYLIYEFKESTG